MLCSQLLWDHLFYNGMINSHLPVFRTEINFVKPFSLKNLWSALVTIISWIMGEGNYPTTTKNIYDSIWGVKFASRSLVHIIWLTALWSQLSILLEFSFCVLLYLHLHLPSREIDSLFQLRLFGDLLHTATEPAGSLIPGLLAEHK